MDQAETALENASGLYSLNDFAQPFKDLKHNFGSVCDFPPTDVEPADELHPFHAENRFVRQRAAAFLELVARGDPTLLTSDLIDELHTSLFDCSAAVRFDIARALGHLQSPSSTRHLQQLLDDEPDSEITRRVARWALSPETSRDEMASEFGRADSPQRRPPAGSEIAVRSFGFCEVALAKRDGRVFLEFENESIEVGETEVKIFLNTSDEVMLTWLTGPQHEGDNSLGDVLRRGVREDADAVFVDQTTYRSAMQALQGADATPTRLLDLSLLATEIVFSDLVLVPGGSVVPDVLAGIVVATDVDEATIAPELYDLALRGGVSSFSFEADGLQAVSDAWGLFLGCPAHVSYEHVSAATKSPSRAWTYQPGDEGSGAEYILLTGPRSALTYGSPTGDKLDKAVSIQTWRYLVNERRAALMGVRYGSSCLRYPPLVVALRNRSYFQSLVDQLMPATSTDQRSSTNHYLRPLRLPHALGTSLRRSSNLDLVLEELVMLRGELQPFRDFRREQTSLGVSQFEQARSLMASILEDASVPKVDGLLQLSSTVAATAGADLGAAALALKLARPLGLPTRAKRFWKSVTHPELSVTSGFFGETSALAASTDEIARLFRANLDRSWFVAIEKCSDLSPYISSRLATFV